MNAPRLLAVASAIGLVLAACSSPAPPPPAAATTAPAAAKPAATTAPAAPTAPAPTAAAKPAATTAPAAAPTTAPAAAPTAASAAAPTTAPANKFAGTTLNLASQSDQYADVLKAFAPDFEKQTGIKVNVDILGYPELYSKITADFVGKTASYDLMTVDIVWSGEFAENKYTVPLDDLIKRDSAQIDPNDIVKVAWTLGGWKGTQIAYPLAGYANILNYRKDVLDAKGLPAPKTMEDLRSVAKQVTDPSQAQFGISINGQNGAAGAQDWMVYNAQLGGKLLGTDGTPTINSDANIKSLEFFKSLFDYSPPGAFDYDWGARETAFKTGKTMMQEGWSVARSSYDDTTQSQIAGKVGTIEAPTAAGMQPTYGFGGWGLGINASSKKADAAWEYIKWITSKDVQKKWVLAGSGSYIRTSTLTDPELLAKFPFQKQIQTSFENGDGDYRPRIPQYSKMQDILGTAVNQVLHSEKTPKEALDGAQEEIAPLFK